MRKKKRHRKYAVAFFFTQQEHNWAPTQAHDGLAAPCPRWRLEFLLQRGERAQACLSEASCLRSLSAT
jgi:hypothetical protein